MCHLNCFQIKLEFRSTFFWNRKTREPGKKLSEIDWDLTPNSNHNLLSPDQCFVPENIHSLSLWKFHFLLILSFGLLAFETPLPLEISNSTPWGGYGYFLEPHNLERCLSIVFSQHSSSPFWLVIYVLHLGWNSWCGFSQENATFLWKESDKKSRNEDKIPRESWKVGRFTLILLKLTVWHLVKHWL